MQRFSHFPRQPRRTRRFVPNRPRPLTVHDIGGEWRPSGAVAGLGVFAVVWTIGNTDWWAPLHCFTPGDQLKLVQACEALDQERGGLHRGGPVR